MVMFKTVTDMSGGDILETLPCLHVARPVGHAQEPPAQHVPAMSRLGWQRPRTEGLSVESSEGWCCSRENNKRHISQGWLGNATGTTARAAHKHRGSLTHATGAVSPGQPSPAWWHADPDISHVSVPWPWPRKRLGESGFPDVWQRGSSALAQNGLGC